MGVQVTHAPIPRCEDVPCAIRSFGGVDVLGLVRPRTARPARAVCDVAPRVISPKGDMPIYSQMFHTSGARKETYLARAVRTFRGYIRIRAAGG